MLDGKVTELANNDINWQIGFHLIKSWDLLAFVGFISGIYDLHTNRYRLGYAFWVIFLYF